ncbi:aldehyde dehydrogenase family protein [Herbiconiux sp. SYSU D00978]|uniref:aldehyde dehydrogenase family protein n=1 Tax=Herbiconiux sp. SYSU D00978 TaxID=2812562 RepID=UPI001A958EF7|nr:aldehyde dehydrogenase family protein [Herbiconiux sp. SYSU D00978]
MATIPLLDAPVTGRLTITDPRDGSTVGEVATASPEDVASAVTRSRAALAGWARTAPAARGAAVLAASVAVAEAADELAELNARETGRPLDQAKAGIMAGADTLRQYAELGPVHRGKSLRGAPEAVDYTIQQPRGVVAALTPWNDPVAVAAGIIGAALVMGNTVIHKPSERCPHLGIRLGEVISAALPDDVLITLTGDGAVGAALAESPVDVIAHVGSTSTGEAIARVAATTGAHVVRENGGNDPLIVDADVDPVWAASQTALGAFANTGQICTSVERIYVHRTIAEPFLQALVAEAESRVGSPDFGPLVDRRMRDAVDAQVQDALSSGATALTGGRMPEGEGAWYPATVLTDCTPDMTIMREETFGPTAPVQVVDSFDEALALAADDRYGLQATVLTRDMEHAHRAAAELPAGTVKVNAVFGGAPGGSAQPRKASGAGFGYGPELLDELSTVKVVHMGLAPSGRA